jgi:hypothetical protein
MLEIGGTLRLVIDGPVRHSSIPCSTRTKTNGITCGRFEGLTVAIRPTRGGADAVPPLVAVHRAHPR